MWLKLAKIDRFSNFFGYFHIFQVVEHTRRCLHATQKSEQCNDEGDPSGGGNLARGTVVRHSSEKGAIIFFQFFFHPKYEFQSM
jgi:hypothetical protein